MSSVYFFSPWSGRRKIRKSRRVRLRVRAPSCARTSFTKKLKGTLRSNDATATKTSLKKWICVLHFLSRLFLLTYLVKCTRTLLNLNSKGPYSSSESEIKFLPCLFTLSIKHEIRHFHVLLVQKRQRNVQKSAMPVQSPFFRTFSLPSSPVES